MAVWLVRAGSHGEFEQKFIQDRKIYVTWSDMTEDLSGIKDRNALIKALSDKYPDTKPKAVQNWSSQLWPFLKEMKRGDLVAVPLKTQPVIYIGEITGDYEYEGKSHPPYFHSRTVKWVGEAIPRSHFSQDILYSLGAFLTICRISRNDADSRIEHMRKNGWKPETASAIVQSSATDKDAEESIDLEETALDQIARLVSAKFKGHGLTRLVDAILRAQGYSTYVSPEGPDNGVDILAGSGSLGFGSPRLCVQVKSHDNPVELKSVTELQGAMTKVKATEGLFVSWSGYKRSVNHTEITHNFFNVRLWSQTDLLRELFANYDKLDEEIRAELALKRIWVAANPAQ